MSLCLNEKSLYLQILFNKIGEKNEYNDNDKTNKKTKLSKNAVTDGRDYLGDFAPLFASINDDILFGQVWSREKELSPRDRSLITIAALMGAGVTDKSMKSHIERAKENGITKEEIVKIITQLSFYTGWSKGWVMFSFAMEIYK